MAEYTRSKVFHPVFGYPGPIPENQLPTNYSRSLQTGAPERLSKSASVWELSRF